MQAALDFACLVHTSHIPGVCTFRANRGPEADVIRASRVGYRVDVVGRSSDCVAVRDFGGRWQVRFHWDAKSGKEPLRGFSFHDWKLSLPAVCH